MNVFYKTLGPIARQLNKISLYFSKNSDEEDLVSEKEIQFLITYIQEKGLMEYEKTSMLQNVFRMGQTLVKEILIPKSDVICINVNDDINTFLDKFSEYQFSRFPVYQDAPENIIGIIYFKFFNKFVNTHIVWYKNNRASQFLEFD